MTMAECKSQGLCVLCEEKKETLMVFTAWTGQGIFEIPLCLDCWGNFVTDSDVIHAVAEKLRAESGDPGKSRVSWVSLAPKRGK